MRRGYERFLRTGINLAPLGVAPGGESYFCTPRGYGETVFAVSSGGGHTAHSALRFEMPPEVEWLPVWREEGGGSEEIRLL